MKVTLLFGLICMVQAHKLHTKTALSVNARDDIDDPDAEDREIMRSIAYAEKSMGTTMKTPTVVRDPSNPWAPVKYDVEGM